MAEFFTASGSFHMNYSFDDSILSGAERDDISWAWPYDRPQKNKNQFTNFKQIRSIILEYFSIPESSELPPPNDVDELLAQLRDCYEIVDLPLDQRNSRSFKGDSGLMLLCNVEGVQVITPDRWFHRSFSVDSESRLILLLFGLPADPVAISQLFKRVLLGRFTQIITIVSVVILAICISLIPTWLQSYIFDTLVPEGSRFLLVQIAIFIFMLHLTALGLNLFNKFIALRLELILGFNLTSLLVHRLILMPSTFFRSFPIGDLQQRINSAHAVRRALQHSFVSLITSVFTVVLNILLIYFKSNSVTLCIYLFLLTLLGPIVDVISACFESFFRYKKLTLSGSLQDSILFPLQSISTVRSLGLEGEMFERFSRLRRRIARLDIKILLIKDILKALSLVLSAFIIAFLFYILSTDSSSSSASSQPDLSSQGMVVLLLSAFSTINGAVKSFSSSLLSFVKVIPDILRFRPILRETCYPTAFPARIHSVEILPIHLQFKIHSESVADNIFRINITPQSNAVILDPDSIGSTQLMSLIYDFGLTETSDIYVSDLQFLSHKRLKIDRDDALHMKRSSVFIAKRTLFSPGSILNNIVDFSNDIDQNRLNQCLECVGISNASGLLDQHVSDVGGTSLPRAPADVSIRLMVARALYLKYRFIMAHQCFDLLENVCITAICNYCKRENLILLASSVSLEKAQLFDEVFEWPNSNSLQ